MDAANQFTIPADFAAGREVLDRLVAELSRRQCSPHAIFAVRLGVEETLIQLIKHRSQLGHSAEHACVNVTLTTSQAQIHIEDDGVTNAGKVIDLRDGR